MAQTFNEQMLNIRRRKLFIKRHRARQTELCLRCRSPLSQSYSSQTSYKNSFLAAWRRCADRQIQVWMLVLWPISSLSPTQLIPNLTQSRLCQDCHSAHVYPVTTETAFKGLDPNTDKAISESRCFFSSEFYRWLILTNHVLHSTLCSYFWSLTFAEKDGWNQRVSYCVISYFLFLLFFIGFFNLHFNVIPFPGFPSRTPLSHAPLLLWGCSLIYPLLPTLLPWHFLTLGYSTLTGPRAFPPIDVQHPLLCMRMEPGVHPCVLLRWWFSPWELRERGWVGCYCSSYGVANSFSSFSPFSNSSIGDLVLSSMFGCQHLPLYLSCSGRASQETAISGSCQHALLGIHNSVWFWCLYMGWVPKRDCVQVILLGWNFKLALFSLPFLVIFWCPLDLVPYVYHKVNESKDFAIDRHSISHGVWFIGCEYNCNMPGLVV